MSDKMYTTCSNCGRRTHIAGCVSKKCQLDNLNVALRMALAEVNLIRSNIERLEKMPDEPEEAVNEVKS